MVWTWNFVLSRGKLYEICGMVLGLHSRGFYSNDIVNIGGVSIVDYTFAEVWLHECRVQRWSEMLDSGGSRVCVLSNFVGLPVVFLSSLHWSWAHTHLYIYLRRSCTLVGPLVSRKSCVFSSLDMSSHSLWLIWRLDDFELRSSQFFVISKNNCKYVGIIKHGFNDASDPKIVADQVSDLSPVKESVFFLSFVFLQTDFFLEVGIQGRCNPRVEQLEVKKRSVSLKRTRRFQIIHCINHLHFFDP